MAQQPPGTSGLSIENILRWVAALAAIGFFIGAYFDLRAYIDTADETHWTRRAMLYGAIEAIAFTAVGWVFGREVNRQRAESAESKAKEAEGKALEEAKQASEARAKGHSLRVAIEEKRRPDGEIQGQAALREGASSQDLSELARIAERLFPD